jgi:hypothetical protein
MDKLRFTRTAFVVVAFSLAFASLAQAQARTFVSASGSDDNACSRTAPCRTFAAAIAAVAAKGEVVALDSAGYGSFTVNKAVTVEAPPGVYAGVAGANATFSAITIAAGATDAVVLRGLTLNGQGGLQGITFTSGGALHIERCVINGFPNDSIQFFGAGKLFVNDSVVSNGSSSVFGIRIESGSGRADVAIERTRVENSGFAIIARDNAHVTVRDSVVAGNISGFGASASGPSVSAEMDIENCVSTGNSNFGIVTSSNPAVLIRVSNSTITGNGTALFANNGSSILTRGNNTVEGNGIEGSFTGTFNAK